LDGYTEQCVGLTADFRQQQEEGSMHKYAFAVPVLPGRSAQEPARAYLEDMDGYLQSRHQMGVALERVYLMPTPMGEFVSTYIESDKDFVQGSRILGSSILPADIRFRQLLKEVHGFDFDAPPAGPPPELIAEWWDPDVHVRKAGLAFVAPLQAGKNEAGRAFAKEAFKGRVDEFTVSRRKLGESGQVVVLNSTPQGDVLVVYHEGDDPAEANRRFAASQDPFDVWFKEECKKIFPEYIDLNVPLPPIQTIWDRQPPIAAV